MGFFSAGDVVIFGIHFNMYIIRENFHLELYGVSGVAVDQNWGKTGMGLMDTMWKEVKGRLLDNKGINVWVYEPGSKMFAGVELLAPPPADTFLESKKISLPKYLYYKHIGSYDNIKDSFAKVSEEAKKAGIKIGLPYLELYGHWTEDVSKLETEMLWSLID
jgi:hypothetical protein